MDVIATIIVALVAAVAAFVFARLNLDHQNTAALDEDLRRVRLETYAALCAAIIEYRRAQLHRWHVGKDIGGADKVERERPEVAQELRLTRAAAWGQFYKVVMIANDDALEKMARAAMEQTREMKFATTADDLDARSNAVHRAVEEIAHHAGHTVRAARQRAASPPPSWSSPSVTTGGER